MADIRQSGGIKDDFNRAPEDPLSNGGKWARPDLASPSLVGKSVIGFDCASHRPGESGFSYWTPDPVMDGDDAECWAMCAQYPPSGSAQGVGIIASVGGTNAADGYLFEIATSSGTDNFRMWKATNWSYASLGTFAGNAAGNALLLIRRNGTAVEGWCDVSGVGDTWVLKITATDSTFTTGFYPMIHTDENFGSVSCGIDNFGSGILEESIAQIYRRPNE